MRIIFTLAVLVGFALAGACRHCRAGGARNASKTANRQTPTAPRPPSRWWTIEKYKPGAQAHDGAICRNRADRPGVDGPHQSRQGRSRPRAERLPPAHGAAERQRARAAQGRRAARDGALLHQQRTNDDARADPQRAHAGAAPGSRRHCEAARGRAEPHHNKPKPIFHLMEFGNGSKNIIAAASALLSDRRHRHSRRRRQTDKARTEDLVKQAVERYTAGLEAARAARSTARTHRARPRCPLTLEDAVRRAIDNNLEMAVERLNPQTFDFTLAGASRKLQAGCDIDARPARQRAAADEPVESRQPRTSPR